MISAYTTPTSLRENIIYLKTQDETKLFTFYKDASFFLARSMVSVADVIANYASPTQVPLSVSGVQCACFNDDFSLIFILGTNGNVILYNVFHETLQTLATSVYFNIKKCYYDGSKNEVTYIMNSPPGTNGTYIWLFNLVSLTANGFYLAPEN